MTQPRQTAVEPDASTLEACRRGDRAAIGRVLSAHSPAVERVIARILGGGPDVEDLLQSTLTAAITAFPRFRGEASVRTWLTRIAVRKVGDHLRRPERRRRVALELVPSEAEPVDAAPRGDRLLAGRRQLARLYHHLDAIGPRKRLAFVLHVFEGKPIEEVAALVGASRVATKSRIFWARRELLARARRDPVLREVLDDRQEEP